MNTSPAYQHNYEAMDSKLQFASKPTYLFTENENILFSTTLAKLRFEVDHNHVPRKFLEQVLSQEMVHENSGWENGQRYINELIDKWRVTDTSGSEARPPAYHKRFNLCIKERKEELKAAKEAELKQAAEAEAEAQTDKSDPKPTPEVTVADHEVALPTPMEVVYAEVKNRVIYRIRGQNDKREMAQMLNGRPYVHDNNHYFANLQKKVVDLINEEHERISMSRENTESRSKEMRVRRRKQVLAEFSTVTGSRTRLRFTYREIAMLLYWIFSRPKSEWTFLIKDFYDESLCNRKAEHVRDKMMKLMRKVTNGFSEKDIKTTASAAGRNSQWASKLSYETPEIRELYETDIKGFMYPSNPAELYNSEDDWYYNEVANEWVNGTPPDEVISSYRHETQKVGLAMKSKTLMNHNLSEISNPSYGLKDGQNLNQDIMSSQIMQYMNDDFHEGTSLQTLQSIALQTQTQQPLTSYTPNVDAAVSTQIPQASVNGTPNGDIPGHNEPHLSDADSSSHSNSGSDSNSDSNSKSNSNSAANSAAPVSTTAVSAKRSESESEFASAPESGSGSANTSDSENNKEPASKRRKLDSERLPSAEAQASAKAIAEAKQLRINENNKAAQNGKSKAQKSQKSKSDTGSAKSSKDSNSKSHKSKSKKSKKSKHSRGSHSDSN